jgi:colicin import membrane protein
MKRAWYFWAAAAVILAASQGCSEKIEPGHTVPPSGPVVKVVVATAQAGTWPLIFEAVGTVQAEAASTLAAKLMGTITSVAVKEGDRVRRGDILATIDERQAIAQRQQAEAALSEARQAERAAEAAREAARKAAEAEAARKAEADRRKAEAEARKKAEEEQRRAEAEKQRLEEQARKAEDARLAKQREENLKRIIGQAGGATGSGGTGTAAQSAAPSAAYAGRLVAEIRRHIFFDTATLPDSAVPEVEVRTAPGGSILSRRLVKSSGHKEWDEAVLRAIDRINTLPRDVDGRVPPVILVAFRPRDS